MRKYLILAMVALAAMVVPSVAGAAVQSLDASITPTKLDKKKFKPVTLFIDVITQNNDEPTGSPEQPPSADRNRVDFTPNLKFNSTAVPNCAVDEGALQNTTTDTAKSLCGNDSIVSVEGADKTSAHVTVDIVPGAPGGGTLPVDVVVTAFNGFNKDTIFLHARADAVNNTSVLVGKLGPGPAGFGSTLDVTVPDLLAGAIDDFKTTVKSGKYVQARCKSRTNKFQIRTEYENHTPTTATTETKCKRKKRKK